MKIILIGPMGAGKTTLGKIVSQHFGWRYIDNDTEMTNRYGYSQADLASMDVAQLHSIESRYLADVVAEPGPFIAGAAASVVDYEVNRALLKSVTAIYLRISLEVAIERAGTTGVGRQVVGENGVQILSERFARRDPLYKECAQLTLELSISPANDAQKVIDFIE